jgi:hypothetical protein
MSGAKPVILSNPRVRRCFVCAYPPLVEWVHESLEATREAGEPKPSVQTILRAAIEQKSLRGFCEKLSKDNLREHLSRHEPIWREWDGV